MAAANNATRARKKQQPWAPCPGNGHLEDPTPFMTGLHPSPWIETPKAGGRAEEPCLPEQALMNPRLPQHQVLRAPTARPEFVKQVGDEDICGKSPQCDSWPRMPAAVRPTWNCQGVFIPQACTESLRVPDTVLGRVPWEPCFLAGKQRGNKYTNTSFGISENRFSARGGAMEFKSDLGVLGKPCSLPTHSLA